MPAFGQMGRMIRAMTKKELSQLYYLNNEIKQQKRKLAELENAATKTNQPLTGLPSAGNTSDKVGAYAAEIADLRALIAINIQKCLLEKKRLERYIQGIDDSLTRQIFRHRFIDGMRWEEVADALQGVSSESVKKQCYRYIKSHS